MITPLKKHPGSHGGLIALGLLAVTILVVVTSRPHQPPPPSPPQRSAPAPAPSPAAAMPAPAPLAVTVDAHAPVIGIGTTDYDETRTSRVGVPVSGWVKKTRARSLGRTVRSGETLAIIYSPAVLLTTVSLVDQVRDFRGQAQLDAVRWRLLRWGMLQPALAQIEKTLVPRTSLPLVARLPGTIVSETGAPAAIVDAETAPEMFTITDPTYAWVYVDVPEADAARIAVGTPASLRIDGIARPVPAKVAHVYRHGSEGLRKIRFELHSARPIIKPNLAVAAELRP